MRDGHFIVKPCLAKRGLMPVKKVQLPFTDELISTLQIGDQLALTGIIYTARDQAHQRLVQSLQKGEPIPSFSPSPILYYAGPTPAKPGEPIGACGPTTSSRMDPFTPYLMKNGFKVCIGKGDRGEAVQEAIRQCKGLYLSALGGCGALYQSCVKSSRCIGYHDLVSEAIYELEIEDFPVFVSWV